MVTVFEDSQDLYVVALRGPVILTKVGFYIYQILQSTIEIIQGEGCKTWKIHRFTRVVTTAVKYNFEHGCTGSMRQRIGCNHSCKRDEHSREEDGSSGGCSGSNRIQWLSRSHRRLVQRSHVVRTCSVRIRTRASLYGKGKWVEHLQCLAQARYKKYVSNACVPGYVPALVWPDFKIRATAWL